MAERRQGRRVRSGAGRLVTDANRGPMTEDAYWTGPHWTFSLRLYGSEPVRAACLSLQERFGLDVSLLFVILYYAVRRGFLPPDGVLSEAVRLTGPVRDAVIRPLRRIRDDIKQTPPGDLAEKNQTVRKAVLQAELLAEQLEQAMLARFLDERSAGASSRPPQDVTALIVAVVSCFAIGRAGPAADDPDIATLSRAVAALPPAD